MAPCLSTPAQERVNGKRHFTETEDDSSCRKMPRRQGQNCVPTTFIVNSQSSATKIEKIFPADRKHCQASKRRTSIHTRQLISNCEEKVFKAVEEGNLELVKTLIQVTGPAVRRERSRCTLLHIAASNNQSDVVRFLLQLISPNVVNKEGQTPAHLAAMKGHIQVLRLLLNDKEFNHHKSDNSHATYKNLLAGPLFKAVLWWNKSDLDELLALEADPDYHAGSIVEGPLGKELMVTTPRQLATVLHREPILRSFPEGRLPDLSDASTYGNTCINSPDFPLGPLRMLVTSSEEQLSGPDVYKMDTESRGYVCILNYSSFQDRPDLHLQRSHTDANNLANIFDKMGYIGDVHSSLSLKETKDVLLRVRDMEVFDDVGCAIFIISSHDVGHSSFLTGDMNHLRTEWVMNLFKDSECPRLKNKPKIFIFDFCNGHYRDQSDIADKDFITEKQTRVDEPLRDAVCLYSSCFGLSSYTVTKDGTPFTKSLCQTLAHHAHDKEMNEFYREFLKDYLKSGPTSAPELRNVGFSKKFYFNPKASQAHRI